MPSPNKGLTAATSEGIRRAAEKRKGQVFTPEQIQRMSDSHKGHHHTEETRQKMSQATSNEKHWNWKGGITDSVHRLRQQMAYTHWKEQVHLRDADTCQHCGVQSATRKLDTHHLKAFKDYPELRYEVSNGITLCGSCHTKEHARLKLLL
jgi:5-methylcytosine-specific restriction endonuclease McrA